MAAARRRSPSSSGPVEIGLEQPASRSAGAARCWRRGRRGRTAGVEAGIVPVDQPQPPAVVDEVGGQQIVVAEHDVDRTDGALEPLRRAREDRRAWQGGGCRLRAAYARSRARRGTPRTWRQARAGIAECRGGTAGPCRSGARDCAGLRTSSGVKVRPSTKSNTTMPGSACTTPGAKPARCAARLAASSFARTTP